MTIEEYISKDNNFDIFDTDLSSVVNPSDSDECKKNILWEINETKMLSNDDIYIAIKNVVECYYGSVAFEN